ncbi:MAG: GTP-binding protein [Patescibacteria group bacterium]|nr:GTP-binding protein [Patescibacteria group bacterium]
MNSQDGKKIRNIAVIAHVDHGKTTLVDAFFKQSNMFRSNQKEMTQSQILDSGELEREKGITIQAKNASIHYKDHKINIIDTPGHADFGGEVERTLNMADGCLLIVDAQEGPMPQTKFVLSKAFELKLKIIVVINKIDKKYANPARTIDKVNDLFLSLAQNSDQLEFPVFYAIGRAGKVFEKLPKDKLTSPETLTGDVYPLLDKIIDYIPCPSGNPDDPFQMQVCSLHFDEHYGKFVIGRIRHGSIRVGDKVVLTETSAEGPKVLKTAAVKNIKIREGIGFVEVEDASVGEIVAVAGINSNDIGATLCSPTKIDPLPQIKITSPSVKITFEANTSPLVGKDGKFVTIKQIENRLMREKEMNIGFIINKNNSGGIDISGRGELQLSILIETLRREGFEFQIEKPEVIFKEEGETILEPLEELYITCPEEYIGTVTTAVSERNGTLVNMEVENKQATITYSIRTKDLLGLRSSLLMVSKGTIVLNNFFKEYVPYKKQKEITRNGVLIAISAGTACGYSLNTTQARGNLFIEPGTEVYEGMIVGINKYETDLEVDVTKERRRSAHRIKHDEITQTTLKQVVRIDLDFALSFIGKDEILEVTPKHLRLRKRYLGSKQRIWAKRSNLSDYARKNLKE